MINFVQPTQNTNPAYIPSIMNTNNAAIQQYLDVFYSDANGGLIIVPVNTTGRVKGATGEFVNVIVDNLTVKNQFTNLYDNNTTADYNFYKLYIDPAVTPRDPCTATGYWPQELSGYKYIDVNKPYYKIQNIVEPYVFSNNNLSQVVGIFLDPSLVSATEQFKVILDPHPPYQYFTADASAAGDPSAGTGFYVEFIATAYDPSYGTTWAQYKHGLPVVGTGGGGGGGTVGPGTPNQIPMFGLPTTLTDSPLSISGTTLYTDDINTSGLHNITTAKVTLLSPTTSILDAARKDYVDQFALNSSVNTALAQFIRSSSTGATLTWNAGILDVSINVAGISFADMQAYVDPSLLVRDGSINALFLNKVNNASLGLYATNASVNAALVVYATNASINAAGFAKNASLAIYATNASVNAAFVLNNALIAQNLSLLNASVNNAFTTTNASVGLMATNSSVNTALAEFIRSASTGTTLAWNAGILDVSINTSGASIAYVDGSLAIRDASITELYDIKADISTLVLNYVTYLYAGQNYALQAEYVASASTGSGLVWNNGMLDVSVALGVSKSYIDGSLALRDTSIAWLNANKANNASLGLYATNASVNAAGFVKNASLAIYATNSSVNTALAQFIRSASTGTSLSWNAGILDVSVNLVGITFADMQAYVDPSLLPYATNASVNSALFYYLTSAAAQSLYVTNSSVNLAFSNYYTSAQVDTLLNGYITQAYVDGSLALQQLQIDSLDNRVTVLENATGFATKDYVDGSISALNASVNLAFTGYTTNTSFGNLESRHNITEASLGVLTTDLQNYATNASIALADFAKNSSVNYLYGWQVSQDASISLVVGMNATQQSQIATLQTRTTGTETSIAYLNVHSVKDTSLSNDFVWFNGYLEVSIAGVTNAASIPYVDGSLANFIRSASTGIGLFWNAGQLDVSIVTGTTLQAWNGLNLIDDSIGLGGTLISDTVIDTCVNAFEIKTINTLNLLRVSLDASASILMRGGVTGSLDGDYGVFEVSPNHTYISHHHDNGTESIIEMMNDIVKFSVDTNYDLLVLDSSGLKYSSDLSSTWSDRSLVDRGYVTSELGSYATNASVNLALGAYATNASIGIFKTNYIDPSLNSKFNTTGGLITGGVQIGTIGTPVDVCIYNNLFVSSHTHVGGNLTVDGSLIVTNVESIEVSAGFIYLNSGLTGPTPPYLQSGIVVQRGDGEPYIFVYDEDNQTFRIGISQLETSTHYSDSSTQAVATREDSPVPQGIAFWNDSLFRFDTSTSLTVNSLLSWENSQDASIVALRNADLTFATNASIGLAEFAKNASLTSLYAGVADVSYWTVTGNNFNLATQILTLSTRGGSTFTAQFSNTYLKEVSIGSGFVWNGTQLDVSVASGVTSLSALTDVSIVSITDNDLLQYDLASGKWKNVALTDASNYFWSSTIPLLREASLNMSTFKWNAGLLEPSVAAGGSTESAWNGLTKTDNSIGLGGTLTQPVQIDVSTSYFYIGGYSDTDPDKSMYFTAYGPSPDTGIYFGTINNVINNTNSIEVHADEGILLKSDNGNYISEIIINLADISINVGGKFFIKDNSSGQGLQYVGDYSSTFVDRSLVDKGYVKNNFVTNASLANYATNASVNTALAQFIRSASTGSSLKWVAGVLDVSTVAVTSLSALTDVSIVSVADKSFLQYDTVSSKWKNVSALDASAYFQTKITKNTVPSSATAGTPGDWSYDASYLYICTSTNLWGRVALSAF